MPTYAEIMNMVPKSRHDIDSMIDLHRKGKEDLESVAERGRRFEQQMGLADNQYARGRSDKLTDDKTEYGRRRGLQQQEGEIDLQIQKEMWGFRGKEAEKAHNRAISMADHAGRIKKDIATHIDGLNLKSTKNLASFNNHIAKLAANQKHNHRILELKKLFEQNKSLRADQLIEKAGLVADYLPQETLNKLKVKGTDWTSEENKWDLIVATTQAASIAAERNEAKVMYDAGVTVGEFKDANNNVVPFDSFWRYDKQNPDAERYPNASMYGTMRKRITDGTIQQGIENSGNKALAMELAKVKFNWIAGTKVQEEMIQLRSRSEQNREAYMRSVEPAMGMILADKMLKAIKEGTVDKDFKSEIEDWVKGPGANPGNTYNSSGGLLKWLNMQVTDGSDAQEAMLAAFADAKASLLNSPEEGKTSWLQQQQGFTEYTNREQAIQDWRTFLTQNPTYAGGRDSAAGSPPWSGQGPSPSTPQGTTHPLPPATSTPPVVPQPPPVPLEWHTPIPTTPNLPVVPAPPTGAAIMPPAFQQIAFSGGGAPMPDANAQLQAMNLAAASQAPVIMNPPIGQLPVAPQQPMYPQGVMNLPAPLPQAQDPYLPLADPNSVMQLAYSNPSIDNTQLQYDPYGTLTTPQLPLS